MHRSQSTAATYWWLTRQRHQHQLLSYCEPGKQIHATPLPAAAALQVLDDADRPLLGAEVHEEVESRFGMTLPKSLKKVGGGLEGTRGHSGRVLAGNQLLVGNAGPAVQLACRPAAAR